MFIAIADILLLAMLVGLVVLLMSRHRGRKLDLVTVSPEVARSHVALIYLIRSTGALMAGAAALTLLYFFSQCVMEAFHGKMGTLGWPGVFLAMGIMTGIFGAIAYVGYRMWLKVDSYVVADFAFLFAILLAVNWYHLLPAQLPQAVINYWGDSPFFVPFREPNPNPSYRALLSYLACYVFYKLIKACLFRILELKAPARLQNPPPDDSMTPEFPQRSPLVPL